MDYDDWMSVWADTVWADTGPRGRDGLCSVAVPRSSVPGPPDKTLGKARMDLDLVDGVRIVGATAFGFAALFLFCTGEPRVAVAALATGIVTIGHLAITVASRAPPEKAKSAEKGETEVEPDALERGVILLGKELQERLVDEEARNRECHEAVRCGRRGVSDDHCLAGKAGGARNRGARRRVESWCVHRVGSDPSGTADGVDCEGLRALRTFDHVPPHVLVVAVRAAVDSRVVVAMTSRRRRYLTVRVSLKEGGG